MGHKKFWKLERNVLKVNLRSRQHGMQENQELGSGRSNIAQKKLTKWEKEVLEAEKKGSEVRPILF